MASPKRIARSRAVARPAGVLADRLDGEHGRERGGRARSEPQRDAHHRRHENPGRPPAAQLRLPGQEHGETRQGEHADNHPEEEHHPTLGVEPPGGQPGRRGRAPAVASDQSQPDLGEGVVHAARPDAPEELSSACAARSRSAAVASDPTTTTTPSQASQPGTAAPTTASAPLGLAQRAAVPPRRTGSGRRQRCERRQRRDHGGQDRPHDRTRGPRPVTRARAPRDPHT